MRRALVIACCLVVCNVCSQPAQYVAIDSDTGTGMETDTDTGTGMETDTDTGTGMDTDINTDSENGNDSGTGDQGDAGTEIENDTDTNDDVDTDTGIDKCQGVTYKEGCWHSGNSPLDSCQSICEEFGGFDEYNTCDFYGYGSAYNMFDCTQIIEQIYPNHLVHVGTTGIATDEIGCNFTENNFGITANVYSECRQDSTSFANTRICACEL